MAGMTVQTFADQVGGEILCGDPGFAIEGVASLTDAAATDLSFLGNPKYHTQFLKTKAGVVLVTKEEPERPENVILIAVENPSFAFAAAVKHFTAALERQFIPGIHPRAIIDDSAKFNPEKVRIHAGAVICANAKIGDGSEIGPNTVIGEDSVIGEDCLLYANVSVRERCLIGNRVIIQPGAVIGSDGFGFENVNGKHVKIPQVGIVEVQDDVEIGANTTVDRARFGRTIIGAGTKIDNLVQISHNALVGEHNLFAGQSGIAGSSSTGKYVVAAAQSGIGGHIHVGDQAVLTARCGASIDIKGGIVYGGQPAQALTEHQRQQAVVRKLPELRKQLRALEKAVQKLSE